MAPSVVPKTEAPPPPPPSTTNLHMTTPTTAATVDQVQSQDEHCGAPSAAVCHICSPPSPQTDPSCFFCSAPYCPLLPSKLLSLSSHKDFISQMSVRLSSVLNDITEEREGLQKQEGEPNDHPEKTELNDTSPGSRDGYFEMGLDDSVEESSSTSSLPVLAPSLPVEEEECEQVQVCKTVWCCCLQINSEEEEIQLSEACLVLTERLLGLLFLSHDFTPANHDTDADPSVSLQQVVSSLHKHFLVPLCDLLLHSDLLLPDSCLCFSSRSSVSRWVVFSDSEELRQTKTELIKLLQLDPVPSSSGLPRSLLNSWELEESQSAEGGHPALLFITSSSSQPASQTQLPPLLQDVLTPDPLLPRLLFLSHRQLYVLISDYRDQTRTKPGLQQAQTRLVRFPLGLVVVHSREEKNCCDTLQHKQRWGHSLELLLCGQRLLLFFPLAQDRALFLGKLSLKRASLEGVRIVALPRTSEDHQVGLRFIEHCDCSQRVSSNSLSTSSVLTEENQPSPHLVPGLSPGLKLLSGLNSEQLEPVFQKHIALSADEDLKQVLWLSVVLYKSPEVELTCLLLLSTNAVYFLLEDSASSLSPHSDIDMLEWADPDVCLSSCLSIPLSQIHSVNVGLFDQYFRILGSSGDQVVCCLSRDSYATGQFLQELMSVLSLQQRAPPPEPSEQDFYSQFNTSGKMQNYELVHSRVKFIYPSEEEMGDLTFIVAERKNGCSSSSRSFNILLYLLVFQVQVSPQSPTPSGVSGPASSGPVLQPRTLILTSTDVFLLDEDYVSYPLPDFAKEPPSRERYHLREARRIRDLDRVLLGYQTYPQALTLVFDELPGPDLLCPLSMDHFSASLTTPAQTPGGAVCGEVQWCVFVPSADSRERLISLLARQWEMLCSRELPVELTG